jgi:hypothetical protein
MGKMSTASKMSPPYLQDYESAMNSLRMGEWPEVKELLSTENAEAVITALLGYAAAEEGLRDAVSEESGITHRVMHLCDAASSSDEANAKYVRVYRRLTVRANRLLRKYNTQRNLFRRELEAMMGNDWEDVPLDEFDSWGYARGELDYGSDLENDLGDELD